jgi:hypothetical protein
MERSPPWAAIRETIPSPREQVVDGIDLWVMP